LYSQQSGFPQWNQNSRSRNSLGNLQSYLQGQVLNSDNSPAAGITVRITGANGTQASMTNSEGQFQFSDLLSGTYEVKQNQA